MNLKTKRTICLMIGITSIITIVSTISYAYFTAVADLNPVESIINTARVSVKFSDYGEEVGGTLSFGESITKRFTIENTGTIEARIKMYWAHLINTYSEESLTYTLSYSENENGPFTEVVGKTNVPESKKSSKKTLANSLTIPVGKKYYYNLMITLNYLEDVNQENDLNAVFNSKFEVEDISYGNVAEEIKALSKGVRTSFSTLALTDEGVFEMEDDYGTSYYYRGAVENNYVKFAGFYWRIIRLNGDGSLRIIYDGTEAHRNGESDIDRFAIKDIRWAAYSNDMKYLGFMYGGEDGEKSTSYEEAVSNDTSSNMKKELEEWYENNLLSYKNFISDTLFCNDRSIVTDLATSNGGFYKNYSTLGFGRNPTLYGAVSRNGYNVSEPMPILKCLQQNDAFTVSDTTTGNGALTYPIGLITADEVVMAGNKYLTTNSSYYLYKGYVTTTLSPYYMYGSSISSQMRTAVFNLRSDGYVDNNLYTDSTVNVAPVINLTSKYVDRMVGDGSMENPYRAG